MNSNRSASSVRPYFVAVVLGTALAAMGTAQAAEISPRALDGISRYCTACWRNARLPPDLWGDCTQEVLVRLLERVPSTAWDQVLTGDSEERREFVRAIDAVKKRRQRERARAATAYENAAEFPDPRVLDGGADGSPDREAFQQAASQVLSARQQRILQMICEGHGIAEIATELNVPADRISDEKYKAVQKLRSHFARVTELNG